MKPDAIDYSLFSGLVFWGSEFLPRDLILSLGNIRKWAFEQGLIRDPEAELVALERVKALREHFMPEDKLAILIHVDQDPSRNLTYLEYPYLPVSSLIKRGTEIEIVYWQMRPTAWDADGSVTGHGEVRLGFWYPGIGGDEFCSMSTAKLVVEKFDEVFHRLSDLYETKTLGGGVLDIEVDGDLRAKFFKTGRLFDVELKVGNQK